MSTLWDQIPCYSLLEWACMPSACSAANLVQNRVFGLWSLHSKVRFGEYHEIKK